MSEELQKAGLFIDDIYRLRVQDPRIANETNELREECLEYANKLDEFRKLAVEFDKIINNYAKDVEKEKLRAIGTQNRLKTMAKQRQAEQQLYQVCILTHTCLWSVFSINLDGFFSRVKYMKRTWNWNV